MSETENLWSQLFQDKPIPEERLESLKLKVMSHILEHPIDFQRQLLLVARRRWGIILLGLLMISGFGLALLVYFKGYLLVELLENLAWFISGFLPNSWLSLLWENVRPNVILLTDLKSVIELLWYDYSWPLMSVLVLLVVIYQSESKLNRWNKYN
ncbi:MAG: hypothetical protein ACYDEJ_02325 [Desulfitobacteriaceae bacterium]